MLVTPLCCMWGLRTHMQHLASILTWQPTPCCCCCCCCRCCWAASLQDAKNSRSNSRRTRTSLPVNSEGEEEGEEEGAGPGGLDAERWGWTCLSCGAPGEVVCCEVRAGGGGRCVLQGWKGKEVGGGGGGVVCCEVRERQGGGGRGFCCTGSVVWVLNTQGPTGGAPGSGRMLFWGGMVRRRWQTTYVIWTF
jgi:hypothetical protein